MQARRIGALCCAGLTLLAAGFVLGQQSPPTDYKLVAEEVLASIDLAKEIDSVTAALGTVAAQVFPKEQ